MRVGTGRTSKAVRINYAALEEVGQRTADAMAALGQKTVEGASSKLTEGHGVETGQMKRSGGFVVYVNKKKVAGNATMRKVDKSDLAMYVGFGFPARFYEMGTIKQPSRPFLSPTFYREAPGLPGDVKRRMAKGFR